MKVALCFWGLCRSTEFVLESIERCILEPLRSAGISFTIYIHTYTLYRPYTNTRSNEFGIQLKNTNWKLLYPAEWIVENQDTVDTQLHLSSYRTKGDPWGNESIPDYIPFETLDNHIRSLWSLRQVTSLWTKSSETYTRVIYLRPDVWFKTPLQFNWIKDPLHNTILIPDFHLMYKCNDRFAIGEPSSMKVYGERFNAAYKYSKHSSLHSEKFLYDIVTNKGYGFRTIQFYFRRIRANGNECIGDKDV